MGQGHHRAGGNHAKKYRKEDPDPEVSSMHLGRYPWLAGVPHFVERKKGVWNPDTTAPNNQARLMMIGHELGELKAEGRITTTDPRHMKESDILEYAAFIRKRDPGYQGNILNLMNGYLRFFRNHALDDLLESGDLRIPKGPVKPIKALEVEEMRDLFVALDGLKGHRGSVARGLVAGYFGTSVRPSELRLTEFKDLDLKRMRIFIRHPKGEGNWASPEWVNIIRGDVVPMLERYLREREQRFEGRKVVPLFPTRDGTFYGRSSLCNLANWISEQTGIEFTFKDFRPTVTSIIINEDPSLEPAMSIHNRHASGDTTRKFYEKIKKGKVTATLSDVWKKNSVIQQPPVSIEQKTPLIESKWEVTGYR